MSDGEDYSILIGKEGVPLPYQNLFVTIHYRNNSAASTTCYTVFEHLRYLSEICDFLKIDLIERCQIGNFLKQTELEKLKIWAQYKVEAFRKYRSKQNAKEYNNIVQLKPNNKKLELARATIVVKSEGDISPHTAYNRLTTFATYIGWLEEILYPSKVSNTEEKLKGMRPEKFGTSDEALDWNDWKSLEPYQVIRVLDVVRPDSSDNPWKSEAVRYRNQLLVNLYETLGCRRGELLKVRVQDDNHRSDIRTAPNGRHYVLIRSQVDKDDVRHVRPEGKTLGRLSPLIQCVKDMYDHYLIYHRPDSIGSEHIPYLFVTHNHKVKSNSALSLAQINKIFREISEVVGFRVHPHAFRHSWNDRFSKDADARIAKGTTTEDKAESNRRKLQGWSDNSKSAQRYAKRYEDERALQIALEIQEKDYELTNSIVGSYDDDIPQ